MLKIEEIRTKVVEIGTQIGLDETSSYYPAFSEPDKIFNEGASVYVTSTQYHYIIMERGNVVKHYKSEKIEDILYPLFENITFTLAVKYELKHRNTDEDWRKLMWQKQLALLEAIEIGFADIRRNEIAEILRISPYKDSV